MHGRLIVVISKNKCLQSFVEDDEIAPKDDDEEDDEEYVSFTHQDMFAAPSLERKSIL